MSLDYTDLCEHIAISADSLTQPQRDAIDSHLDALTGSLAAIINRPLEVAEFTETLVVDQDWGRPILANKPLVRILELVVNGQPWPSIPDEPSAWITMSWAYGTAITVRYLAGIDAANDAHIRGALLNKVTPYAQALIARAQIVAGETVSLSVPAPPPNVRGFSVEGLNVQYQHSHELALAAIDTAMRELLSVQWTPPEMVALGLDQRRRPVVA